MFWYFVQLLVQLIIAFLLGLLVGWLLWARTLRKRTQLYVRETRGLRGEIEGFGSLTTEHASLASAHLKLTDAHAALGVEHAARGADHAALMGELVALKASTPPQAAANAVVEKAAAVNPAAVKGATAKPVRPDDLKRVEGIGPKMEQALRAAGIETFAQLASAAQGELQSAIDAAKLMSPSVGTWAKQARFLADGDGAGFVAYIEHLVGGVEPGTTGER